MGEKIVIFQILCLDKGNKKLTFENFSYYSQRYQARIL